MKVDDATTTSPVETPKKPTCGLVMPISGLDSCSPEHWEEVRAILSEAIEAAGFEPHMVSDSEDSGIIQKRIIQNLYENPIIVCDVSGKNPNVMFELGIRLAFDKPTIIVKDDKTSYSFDTAPIEHLEYPRDLRFAKIVEFKEDLTDKVQGTYQKSTKDKNYTTFLKNFGTFTIPKLETQEVPRDAFILDELQSIRRVLTDLTARPRPTAPKGRWLCLKPCPKGTADAAMAEVSKIATLDGLRLKTAGIDHYHIIWDAAPDEAKLQALLAAKVVFPKVRLA